jgi:ADP-ribose pyrophosphatase YjhB (NUDIX family)
MTHPEEHEHGHAAAAHTHAESLNPALEGLRFCPRCGAAPEIDFPRSLRCENCGYAAFYNPKPVAGAIPRDADGRIWLLRRGFDPAAGLWTFPGGFVDLEELEIEIELTALLGVYSRPQDRVLLVVFEAIAHGEPRTTDEAPEIRAFAPHELPWDELAFWSTEQALRDLLDSALET